MSGKTSKRPASGGLVRGAPALENASDNLGCANALPAESPRTESPRMSFRMSENGKLNFQVQHADEATGTALMMTALGTSEPDFALGLLQQIMNIASIGKTPDAEKSNFMLSMVKGIGPRDEVESMLAAQMAAVHSASMTFARRLTHVENLPQQDAAERAFNKLTRTFAAQVEALKRYRTGGEQKVTVQHVHVSEGGQAIVGNVNATTPGDGAKV